jgi:hypothetical protein
MLQHPETSQSELSSHQQEPSARALALGSSALAGDMYPEEISPKTSEDIVNRYETEGWVAELPSLHDQVADTTRLNTFEYVLRTQAGGGMDAMPGEQTVTMTEHDGLVALDAFLSSARDEALTDENGEDLSELAGELQQHLNFVGEKEYQEGAEGIKVLWQSYLDTDPELQLCISEAIGNHMQSLGRKSDAYLIERVMNLFTEEELANYGDRIVYELGDITAAPEHTKIIIADDWTMSGTQVNTAEQGIRNALGEAYGPSIEVNLLAASEERLQEGMGEREPGDATPKVPVKAYYKTRSIEYAHRHFEKYKSPVTGTHSSGDFGFEHVLEDLAQAQSRRDGTPVYLPPLANVVRTYRGELFDDSVNNPFG